MPSIAYVSSSSNMCGRSLSPAESADFISPLKAGWKRSRGFVSSSGKQPHGTATPGTEGRSGARARSRKSVEAASAPHSAAARARASTHGGTCAVATG